MTNAIESQYQFTAEVKSKGKQQNRDGWTMTLDWRLPGSKYDLTLYGSNWETVGGFEVGQTAAITIHQGNLRANKDGKYSSDFFWDLESIEDEAWEMPDEPVQAPPRPTPKPVPPARTGGADTELPPNPAALGVS